MDNKKTVAQVIEEDIGDIKDRLRDIEWQTDKINNILGGMGGLFLLSFINLFLIIMLIVSIAG